MKVSKYNLNMISCGLKRYLVWWVCLGWGLVPLSAETYFIRNYQQQDGLPTSIVNTGLRSLDGFAWFGTPGGLFRYDGDVFLPYRIENGLASNGIRRLLVWGGDLWIGTTAGLNRFDGKGLDAPIGNPNSMVTALTVFEEQIWSATVDGGVYAGDKDGFHRVPLDGYPGYITDMAVISGKLWLLFSRPEQFSAMCWDGKTWVGVPTPSAGLQPRFFCVWQGKTLVGTDQGLWSVTEKTAPLLAGIRCTAGWNDADGRLWVGTEQDGVFVGEPDGWRHLTREKGLADNHVEGIFGDEEGLIWICTGRGVSKLISLAYRGWLDDLPVMAMAEYDGMKWFATDEAGVLRLGENGENRGRLGAGSGLPSEHVRALAVFQETLYAGTKAGLRQWKNGRFEPTGLQNLGSEYILNLQVLGGRLWISTLTRGVVSWDGQQMIAYDQSTGLPSNTVWSVALGGQTVWIGTEGGLCRLDGLDQSKKAMVVRREDGLGCDQIRALHFDEGDQVLWVATGNGLYRFHNGAWSGFSRAEGLTSLHVSSLLPVGTDLWLGTENGIFILTPEGIRPGLTAQTGLVGGEECSGVSSLVNGSSGTVWYLSTTGATEIEQIPPATRNWSVPLRITGIRSGDLELPMPPSRAFPRGQNDLTFSFRALSLADERQIRYRLRLDGLDGDWSEASSSASVRYTNLTGGSYTLRVQAKTADGGSWSPESRVAFEIEPAFYERGWVIGLALALFAGFSYFLGMAIKRTLGAITFFRRVRYLGHFKILETLGSGGMGVVYKAADLQNSGRIVALKVLKNEGFASDSGKRRFQLEGSIIDQFDHPGIVRNLERGEMEGKLYIAMEFIDGTPLNVILREQGALPVSKAVKIMLQLLDVLDRLHQKGVLHRDLKPENLMVLNAEPTRVKLLDFGLALRESQTRLTQTGTVMGTLHFLPPERILSGISTPKGDVYGAGVLFFELLSGNRPFEGEGLLDVMKAIIETTPLSLRSSRPELPPLLIDLVECMMDRNPDLRPTARAALERLKALDLGGEG